MGDNTDDEPLDTPANAEPENPPGKTIPAIDTETFTQNQESENMEVHHHSTLHHKPKKWKEYFLEFLMIFLAVTLGFFAENLREYFGDQKMEKEYMESMVADLKSDTIELGIAITRWKHINANTDSMLFYLRTDLNQLTVNKLYKFESNDFSALTYSNTIIRLLKN